MPTIWYYGKTGKEHLIKIPPELVEKLHTFIAGEHDECCGAQSPDQHDDTGCFDCTMKAGHSGPFHSTALFNYDDVLAVWPMEEQS